MQVTSSYYRCRAQRAAFSAESLTLLGEDSRESHPTAAGNGPSKPLSPSSRTLRCLADLRKPETQHRVA